MTASVKRKSKRKIEGPTNVFFLSVAKKSELFANGTRIKITMMLMNMGGNRIRSIHFL